MGALEIPNAINAAAVVVPVPSDPFTTQLVQSIGVASFDRIDVGQYSFVLESPLSFQEGVPRVTVPANTRLVAGAQILSDKTVFVSVFSSDTGEQIDPDYFGFSVLAIVLGEGVGPELALAPLPPPIPSSGDVTGPGSAVDNQLARFSGATGKIIKTSLGVLDDLGNLTGIASYNAVTINGDGATQTFVGRLAGNVTGSAAAARATMIGDLAGAALTTGLDNTFIGWSAGQHLSIAARNTAIGSGALQTATVASNNTAVGYQALNANLAATACTAIGSQALLLSTAINNTAVGAGAGGAVTTGANNTLIGRAAGVGLVGGARNTLIGQGVASAVSAGDDNTCFGHQAGSSITTSTNIMIGSLVDTPNAALPGQLNIGNALFGSLIAGDLKFRFGGSGSLAAQDSRMRIVSAQDQSHPIMQLDNSNTLFELYGGIIDPGGVVNALAGAVFVRVSDATSNVYINRSVGTGNTWAALI